MVSIAELIRNDRPNITDSSIKTYVFSLKKLGIINIEDIDKVNNPNDIFEKIKDIKVAQQRNLLSAVLIIIKAVKMPNELYEIYRKKCFDLGIEYQSEMAKNEKTETQEKNWIKIDELKQITNKLIKQTPDSQNTLIAALYSFQPPTRLDYYDMQIIKPSYEMDNTKNYLLIHNSRRKEFIFNDYKTSSKYNTVRIPVSKELNRVINKFLKLNPDRNYLLQNKKGFALTRNQLGKLIPIIFKETGKNVTLNIIRHCYISEKVDLEAVKSFKELAKNMMHSASMQEDYNKN
tara:strand:- start:388 stop:1257 length:870 start_codon:yes stop_codon:yes gene_type:complete